MENIASKFGIQVSQLRNVNNLPAQQKIKNSSTILVPNGNRADFTASTNTVIKDANATESTKSNISTEQDSANIDMASTANNATNNKNEIEPAKQRSVTHKVKKGENMQSHCEALWCEC